MSTLLGMMLAIACWQEEKAELGKVVPDLVLKDLKGNDLTLSTLRKNEKGEGKVVLVVFWSYKCPSGRRILDRVKALAKRCEKKGVAFVGLCAYGETSDQIKEFAEEKGITYPLVFDEGKKGAKLFGAKVVTSAYVLDREGKLVYRGGWMKAWAAAEETVAGKEVTVKTTRARG